MPKHLVDLKPGSSVPPELRDFLSQYFERGQIERLERLGGRVSVSFVAPYVRRSKRDQKVAIDETFLGQLKAETANAEKLQELLAPLTAAQLKELCRLLGEPVRSSANRGEIASNLVRNLQAEGFWHRISSAH